MSILRKFLRATAILLISLIVLSYAGCQITERQHWKKHAPHKIGIKKTWVFDTGCDLFWCAGGALYQLDELTIESIKTGGEHYLNSLGHFSKNNNTIGVWSFSKTETNYPSEKNKYAYQRIWFGNQYRDDDIIKTFRKSLRKDGYYVSSRNSEPLIVISPNTGMMYIGWFD